MCSDCCVQEKRGGVQNVRTSNMNFVDLAGSERQKDTNAAGQRLKVSVRQNDFMLGSIPFYRSPVTPVRLSRDWAILDWESGAKGCQRGVSSCGHVK
jgi:hypothetical protein